jgi:hypothetical protein
MDIAFIELNFPKLYEASKEYHSFKNTIIKNRIKMFGENSLEDINDFIKYNKILDKGKLTNEYPNTFQGKAAYKENELHKALIDESKKIKQLYNIKNSDISHILDLLTSHFELTSIRK